MLAAASMTDFIASARRADICARDSALMKTLYDGASRFPAEAVSALRAQRLLGILVPAELGGEGATISDVVDICYALGRSCGSTAMIYAMHQIMVACLVRHARHDAWHMQLLQRL